MTHWWSKVCRNGNFGTVAFIIFYHHHNVAEINNHLVLITRGRLACWLILTTQGSLVGFHVTISIGETSDSLRRWSSYCLSFTGIKFFFKSFFLLPDWENSVTPYHSRIWLVIASGMTIFIFLKTGLNLKETLAKNILAYVSVNFSIK